VHAHRLVSRWISQHLIDDELLSRELESVDANAVPEDRAASRSPDGARRQCGQERGRDERDDNSEDGVAD
jgi:hypothetical protein